MDLPNLATTLIGIFGSLGMWLFKRTLDQLGEDLRTQQTEMGLMKQAYLRRDDFKDFKEELWDKFADLKEEIRDMQNAK